MRASRPFVLLAFFAGLLVFYGVEARPILRSAESRVAQVAQELREDGDWVVGHLNGEVRIEKPPFSSWLVALVSILTGSERVEPWHAFLPPGLAAVALVVLLAAWLGTSQPYGAGLLAGFVLATAPGFLTESRSAELDMLLALWVTLAFWGFWKHRLSGRAAPLLLAYTALGLAVLTKAHVGLVVVVPPVIAWTVWERTRTPPAGEQPRRYWHLVGIAAMAAVVLPWAIPFLGRGILSWQAFSREGLERFGKSTGHQEHVLWYFHKMPEWFLPWILVWPLAAWQTRRQVAPASAPAGRDAGPTDAPLRRLCWVWLGWGVLMFSAMAAKQRHYVLLLFPAVAILIGDALSRWLTHPEETTRRRARQVVAGFGALSGVGGAAFAGVAVARGWPIDTPSTTVLLSGGLALVGFGTGSWQCLHERPFVLRWWLGAFAAVVLLASIHERAEARKGPEPFCRAVRQAVPPSEPLYDYSVVFANNAWRGEMLFYLQRKVTRPTEPFAALMQRPKAYALVNDKALAQSAAQDYEFLVRAPRLLGHANDVFLVRSKAGER